MTNAKKKLVHLFDVTQCVGCKACIVACAETNYPDMLNEVNSAWDGLPANIRVMTLEKARRPVQLLVQCQQCDNAPCVTVCPFGANFHDPATGNVKTDPNRCIGCGYCTMACPYHAPHIDARLKRSSKCDGCRDRLVDGGQPVCVEACPLRALEFGLTSELTDRHPDAVRSILPLPDESATRPNLLILPSPAAERAEKQGGSIVNRTELHL